jgi:V8-like Glu-specific endopeptidase
MADTVLALAPRVLASLLVTGGLIGCGVAEGTAAPIAERSSEIVGGTMDNADPAVVALTVAYHGTYAQYCTGTLVGPKTVVTAAHCIDAYGPANYFVNFGTYAVQPTQTMAVAQQFAHPQYDENVGDSHDFGVLQLANPVLNVTPIEMNPDPFTQADVGRAIRHVGYGDTNGAGAGNGTKREVLYTLRQVSLALLESGAQGKQTCHGDSGGPGLMVMPGSPLEKLVGVVSFGDQNCNQYGQDGRVDVDLPWIKQTMAPWEAPTCGTDGKCVPGCTPVDQDCACLADGVCSAECSDLLKDPDCPRDCAADGICSLSVCPRRDVDCVEPGGACGKPTVCTSRVCIGDDQHPNQKYCSQACQPGATVCPEGMECSTQLVCQLKQKPVVQPGERCDSTADYCAGGRLCTGPSGGLTRCVDACTGVSDCPAPNSCEGGADGQRYCRPPESVLRFSDIVLTRASAEGNAASTGCSATGLGDLSMMAMLLAGLALARRRAC